MTQRPVLSQQDEQRPAKRARLEERQQIRPGIEYPTVAGYRIASYMAPGRTLTLADQIRIYHAWQASGSPHNHVCYTCRKPGKMLECRTCCRSYHSECLESPPEPEEPFYCPPCRGRGWHEAPPLSQPLPAIASNRTSVTPTTTDEAERLNPRRPGEQESRSEHTMNPGYEPPNQQAEIPEKSTAVSQIEQVDSSTSSIQAEVRELRAVVRTLQRQNKTLQRKLDSKDAVITRIMALSDSLGEKSPEVADLQRALREATEL